MENPALDRLQDAGVPRQPGREPPDEPHLAAGELRPEYRHAWGNKSAYLQARLDPLPPDRVEDLLRWILGNDPGLQSLRALLIERTEGNPFFLEESVRTLIETRALAGERGAYRVAKPVEDVQIPATVQAVLAARIDRLPPDEKWLLQAAAVIGKDVPHRVLHAVVNRADEDLRREVAHLLAAEFLYETQLFPDLEYTFKHALSHDVAYEGLLQGQRRNLHAGVVAAFETPVPGSTR